MLYCVTPQLKLLSSALRFVVPDGVDDRVDRSLDVSREVRFCLISCSTLDTDTAFSTARSVRFTSLPSSPWCVVINTNGLVRHPNPEHCMP